jgi:hypothetical protein
MRLILHTAAYWAPWRIQHPKVAALAAAEFTTLRLRLLKVAARAAWKALLASASPLPRYVRM